MHVYVCVCKSRYTKAFSTESVSISTTKITRTQKYVIKNTYVCVCVCVYVFVCVCVCVCVS